MNTVKTLERTKKKKTCHHCGMSCSEDPILLNGKQFCCNGCLSVYELFEEAGLSDFYLKKRLKATTSIDKYVYLKNDEIVQKLLDFSSETHNKIRIKLPDIHCSSCIHVLEHLHKINQGVIKVTVNFLRKEASIDYNPKESTLIELATLLDAIGYPPQFETSGKETKKNQTKSYLLSIKIGIAAFCFGNIMLLSFPGYLGIDENTGQELTQLFLYLNVFLSLPIVFYAGNDYFSAAWKGLKKGIINIDVPIAIGIATLFLRSLYEVIFQTGIGYFDSMAGLVLFLLIGRWFQNKTYENLSFERDYRSYFPLAVLKKENDQWISTPIQKLKRGDEIIIRNEEVIPADAVLLSKKAMINYSFVTGEEDPVEVKTDQHIYAGGKLQGAKIHLSVIEKSSQSYLTSLWNNQVFKKHHTGKISLLTNQVSHYFTPIVLTIAALSAVYWMVFDPSKTWEVFTAVLIVACPCALALSAPFSNGNAIRVLGRNKFYLKKAALAEQIPKIDTIIFDKTGTITEPGQSEIIYTGLPLTSTEKNYIKQLVANSTHPKSKQIYNALPKGSPCAISVFNEFPGKGIMGYCDGEEIKVGSAEWLEIPAEDDLKNSRVYVSIGGLIRGAFKSHNAYRSGLKPLTAELSRNYELKILSGDNSSEKQHLLEIFPSSTQMYFNQTPHDKLTYIESLQEKGHRVMMVGDGLNDAGALKQSDIGIAVTDDTSSFSPACEGILEGSQLSKLDVFIAYCKRSNGIIIASFVISFFYNIIGLSFAVSGFLTPIFAAILMPLSSISVVAFTTASSNFLSKKLKLNL